MLVEQCALTYAYVFGKRPGCVLIGACALIRTNTVFFLQGQLGQISGKFAASKTVKLAAILLQQNRSCYM